MEPKANTDSNKYINLLYNLKQGRKLIVQTLLKRKTCIANVRNHLETSWEVSSWLILRTKAN